MLAASVLVAALALGSAAGVRQPALNASLETSTVGGSTFFGPHGPIGQAFAFTYISSTGVLADPVVDAAGNVYFSATTRSVWCVLPSGKPCWSYNTAATALQNVPVVAGGSLYIGTSTGAYALDTATGGLAWVWSDGLNPGIPSTVILSNLASLIFIAGRGNANGGLLYGVNTVSGVTSWTTPTAGGSAGALFVSPANTIVTGYPGVGVSAGSVVLEGFAYTSGMQTMSVTVAAGQVYSMFMFQQDNAGNVYVGYNSGTTVRMSPMSQCVKCTCGWTCVRVGGWAYVCACASFVCPCIILLAFARA